MRVSQETLQNVMSIHKPDQLADVIAANALTQFSDRQELLEITNVQKRLEKLCTILLRETELSELEKSIQARIKLQIEKNQRISICASRLRPFKPSLATRMRPTSKSCGSACWLHRSMMKPARRQNASWTGSPI